MVNGVEWGGSLVIFWEKTKVSHSIMDGIDKYRLRFF